MKIGELTKLAKKAGVEPELKKIASEVTPVKADTESARVKKVVDAVLNSTEATEEEKLAAAEFGERISDTVMKKIAGQVEANEDVQAAKMVKLGYMFGKGMKLAEGETIPLDELAARAEQIAATGGEPPAAEPPAVVPPAAAPEGSGGAVAEAVGAATSVLVDKVEELAAGKPAEGAPPPAETPPAMTPEEAAAAAAATPGAEGSETLPPEVLKEIEGQFPKESQDPSAVADSIVAQVAESPALAALVQSGDVDLASDELAKAVTSGQTEAPAGNDHAPETALGAEDSAAALAAALVEGAVGGEGEGEGEENISDLADEITGEGEGEGEAGEGEGDEGGEPGIADLIAGMEQATPPAAVVENAGEVEIPPAMTPEEAELAAIADALGGGEEPPKEEEGKKKGDKKE